MNVSKNEYLSVWQTNSKFSPAIVLEGARKLARIILGARVINGCVRNSA